MRKTSLKCEDADFSCIKGNIFSVVWLTQTLKACQESIALVFQTLLGVSYLYELLPCNVLAARLYLGM